MVKIPRRKTVKNTQVGLCGDMHVFHGQCTATIQERETRHSPNLMWCGMLSNTSRRRRVCFRTCTDGWCTTCQHPVSIDSPGSPHVVSRGQGDHWGQGQDVNGRWVCGQGCSYRRHSVWPSQWHSVWPSQSQFFQRGGGSLSHSCAALVSVFRWREKMVCRTVWTTKRTQSERVYEIPKKMAVLNDCWKGKIDRGFQSFRFKRGSPL